MAEVSIPSSWNCHVAKLVGLQCHTAPYSWKLVFLSDHQLYEVILTACTPKEEMEWCSRIGYQLDVNDQDHMQPANFSFLALNIKSLGTVFRKPGACL